MSGFSLGKNNTLFPAIFEGAQNMNSNTADNNLQKIHSKKNQIMEDIYNYQFRKAYFDNIEEPKDILDNDGNFRIKNKLSDAVQEDIQTILIQENTLYMVGIVTTATMILAAILISK